MKIGVQNAAGNFEHLAEQFQRMLDELNVGNFFCSQQADAWAPKINLYETTACFLVCAELAGMPREQIDVRATGKMLQIQGVRSKPTLPNTDGEAECGSVVGVQMMEIDSGRFERRIPLPEDVQVSKIWATYRNGYLWVILPRGAAKSDA